MNFCEHCNIAIESEICQNCNRKTRQINDEDVCFFGEYDTYKSDMLIQSLVAENISYAVKPVYIFAYKAKYGLPDKKQIYLRFCDFDKAKEIYVTMFNEEE